MTSIGRSKRRSRRSHSLPTTIQIVPYISTAWGMRCGGGSSRRDRRTTSSGQSRRTSRWFEYYYHYYYYSNYPRVPGVACSELPHGALYRSSFLVFSFPCHWFISAVLPTLSSFSGL